jgi:hypothetical protein
MKWDELLEEADSDGLVTPPRRGSPLEAANRARQVARWVAGGRLTRLRRGLYVVNAPYRVRVPHPFRIAARLVEPSYVSLESALAYRGVGDKVSAEVSSVTTRRTTAYETPLGRFRYRVVKPALFGGFDELELPDGQIAPVATAEKALVDLLYLAPPGTLARQLAELGIPRSSALSWGRVVAMIDELEISRLSREVRGL